ncbi:MAG TPA: hypothetical protein PLZ51_01040, partial [Aggregatilineales bacterium]|nr:hypothetical protein [Aggregatilineales bacterium]
MQFTVTPQIITHTALKTKKATDVFEANWLTRPPERVKIGKRYFHVQFLGITIMKLLPVFLVLLYCLIWIVDIPDYDVSIVNAHSISTIQVETPTPTVEPVMSFADVNNEVTSFV